MGLNSEYRDDLLYSEDAFEPQEVSDQDDQEFVLDPQSWEDWHSEDLLNMWMSLQTYLQDRGMSNTLLNEASFNNFCEFVRFFSQ
jgi:hypothetical protein